MAILNDELIAALYATRKTAQGKGVKTANRPHKLITRVDGELVVEYVATLPMSLVGGYDGKAGTMKRSRKGRSSRNANGRRFYNPNYEREVIAYG